MGAPLFTQRTVGDAARDLIRAADALALQCGQADEIVAALEARWAANRAAHAEQGGLPPRSDHDHAS